MSALDETWNWKVILVQCPECRAVMPDDESNNHATWHWLTDTETKKQPMKG